MRKICVFVIGLTLFPHGENMMCTIVNFLYQIIHFKQYTHENTRRFISLFRVLHRVAKSLHLSWQKCIHIKKTFYKTCAACRSFTCGGEWSAKSKQSTIIIKWRRVGRFVVLPGGALMPSHRCAPHGCLQRSNSAQNRQNDKVLLAKTLVCNTLCLDKQS